MKEKNSLEKIIGSSESTAIEWKQSLAETKEIIASIAAFANTEGGKIIIGACDKGTVKGVAVGKGTIENFTNKIRQNLQPVIHPKISIEKIREKQIIVVTVKEALDKTILAYGLPYKRVGKSSVKMGKDEYEHLILEKHKAETNFDSQICKEATLKNIDWKFVKDFFIPLYEDIINKKISGTPEKVLESLGCVRKRKPTNAGILLFGEDPQKFFMNVYIAVARYKGKEVATERLDYKEFTGNILKQIDDCDNYIKEHTAIMSKQDPSKIQRDDIPEYGKFSIRELITNTICHRDYTNQNTKIIIKMFDNSIEFYNPGGLPKPITPQNITKKQFSRNPTISKVLAKVLYIEELGEGWDKIIEEHKKHFLKPKIPHIESDDFSTLVTIFSSKEKFIKQLEKEKHHQVDLNERQKKAIGHIKKYGKITKAQYMEINKISHKTAYVELNDMIKNKVIVREGKSRATVFLIK